MAPRAFITGLAGPSLTPEERDFLREADPWGLILFKRNINSPAQLVDLTTSIRDSLHRPAPILVDQEGGRVQRLGPPHWPVYPPAAVYGSVYDDEPALGRAAARLGGRLIASDLFPLGIDVDCLPVADMPAPGSDPIIGDRAYGHRPDKIATLAAAMTHGLQTGGVLPVLKHLPGHGRAEADSHLALPRVETDRVTLEATDFAPFQALAALPLGMTAHVVFSAIDPLAPATTSATMVQEVIRGLIGFQGLLMSDDIAMNALSGTIGERARAALAAGCDVVLHCNGKIDEMREVASNAPALAGTASTRAEAALAARAQPSEFDREGAREIFARMIAAHWVAPERNA
jgi:beta-N-acetylhexosaminidase